MDMLRQRDQIEVTAWGKVLGTWTPAVASVQGSLFCEHQPLIAELEAGIRSRDLTIQGLNAQLADRDNGVARGAVVKQQAAKKLRGPRARKTKEDRPMELRRERQFTFAEREAAVLAGILYRFAEDAHALPVKAAVSS